MDTYVPNYLWGEMIPIIDNAKLMEDCLHAEDYLINKLPLKQEQEIGRYGNITTASHNQYNLLSFPIESFQVLYHNMVAVIRPCLPKEPHVIQCWLNVFRDNGFIDWHDHWPSKYRVIHGFYCVNVTPSFTEYKFAHAPMGTVKVESKEGLLVFGKSDGDEHRSSPWSKTSEPRITIAFDVIPVSMLENFQVRPNHYLPF